ncbi:hypothetical protein BD626DRAFT_548051 [Schizophyllum amplum]|uniref:Uncharacterized protein n=1 Tax=Schizophyllum amplum TaxID=97359 RepID=A0A550CFW5_9AGAR|nr:hypothetical protein BD626DRAFT_548051 [Auriculariopsis ampla]
MLGRPPRRRFHSFSDSSKQQPPSAFVPTPTYPHVSVFRSLQMEVRVYSPTIHAANGSKPMAAFTDREQVGGRITLDPSCCSTGRLTITLEGAFLYPERESKHRYIQLHDKRKHVFFTTSTTMPVSPEPAPSIQRSATAIREALTIRRRPSGSSLRDSVFQQPERSFPFCFEMPQSQGVHEELPPTLSFVKDGEQPYEVNYSIIVLWEASDALDDRSFLEVPIMIYSDVDFESLDGKSTRRDDSWLEMPLKSDRPIPFRCAISFFVVFTTTPRSASLAREIASDATVSVSLVRQITVKEVTGSPPNSPSTSEESDVASAGSRLLKRVVRRAPSSRLGSQSLDDEEMRRNKPLPTVPHKVFSDSQKLHACISVGFPKRPRKHAGTDKHPPLESQMSLPDGLYKDKIALQKTMTPSISWRGVTIKYYLDVSVSFGQDEMRGRIPIRIV